MTLFRKISTGLDGLDEAIDFLRPGDNVVWKVESPSDYKRMVEPFALQARRDKRKLIYVRFGSHEPMLDNAEDITLYSLDAGIGFERFATEIHELVKSEGRKAFYVFDCLTDLLQYWHADVMISNFFRVTCPYLYELETVAYFGIRRNVHTFPTIAGIRETTQLLLDLYEISDQTYVHPLKVWQRYSPTMFFPHRIDGSEASSITASSEVAELFSAIHRSGERPDYWDVMIDRARDALTGEKHEQDAVKRQLMQMMIGEESRIFDLCHRYMDLEDILAILSRQVGTGFIGGKSVGMLVARRILEDDEDGQFTGFLEPHDSYYLGSDIFYTYIVQNGWWRLHTNQRTQEGYYKYAGELRENLLTGTFSKDIEEQFQQMLEYFGQSPVIVRSSSLLEDNFGNAFAGKYASVFCANQGTPDERFEAFENAVRTVYASTMNEDALQYRMNRGLFERDEQMAILVQRVSGDQHGDDFFPHGAGVGNSSNLYVWDKSIDMSAGMLRMVFGLGTRAVDRSNGDYAKIICLDDPLRAAPVDYGNSKKYSQKGADMISLSENRLLDRSLDEVFTRDIRADKELFASPDYHEENRLRDLGYTVQGTPMVFDFKKMMAETKFPHVMKNILAKLSKVYDYPVDIEFTVNFTKENNFKINLLQCRPLQTRGLGKSIEIPEMKASDECFFSSIGNFMGGNVRLPLEFVVYVKPLEYLDLSQQNKYSVARCIGMINTALKGRNVLLCGPGRWGTTTPSLGIPVHFSEVSNVSVLCEVSLVEAGFMPELSYGSHFFQDLVEAGIFYAAIFDGTENVVFHPEWILHRENILAGILPQCAQLTDVVHIVKTEGLELFSDIVSQRILCR